MISATKEMLQKTFDYKSKLTRPEFWWGYLGYIIIAAVLATIFIFLNDNVSEIFALIGMVVLLCLELSMITAFMKRLNDAGINKGFAVIFIIPFGIFVLLFLLAQPSEKSSSEKSE